jgi:hypothetical protein
MMRSFLVAVISLSSMAAHAGDNLGPLMISAENPFQVLKAAFDTAQPADLNDFPLLADLSSATPSMKCVGVGAPGAEGIAEPTDLTPAILGRVILSVPATPGNGPLFPGTPATTHAVIPSLYKASFGSGWSNSQWAADITTGDDAGVVTTSKTASGDLQSVSTFNDAPGLRVIDTLRKQGSLLFSHEVSSGSSSGQVYRAEAYAYCYPRWPA